MATAAPDAGSSASLRPRVAWVLRALRIPFVIVYLLGVGPEVLNFWSVAAKATTLCLAAFSAFSLLGSLAFGLARALPAGAGDQQRDALVAGKRSLHAAVLSLGALLLLHGAAEGWPGIALLRAWSVSDAAFRALLVGLGAGAAIAGLRAIWSLEALALRETEFGPARRADEVA